MFFLKSKTIKLSIIAFAILMPLSAGATLQSSSYVIYENVMHTFDGPVISGVSASVDITTATVAWTTNIVADAFVIYSTDSGFATSQEQGTSAKDVASHSVAVSGLAESTTYYYKVKSTRVNGGTTIDPTVRSFTTGAEPVEPQQDSGGGGGIIIIDKTDKVAPVITNVVITNITDQSAEVSWETDEAATGFAEYGLTAGYGATTGAWATSTKHKVIIENLKPETAYHLRAISSDGWGNVGRSADQTITTAKAVLTEEEKAAEEAAAQPNITTETIIQFVRKMFPIITPAQLAPNPLTKINSAADLTRLIPTPRLSGEPKVEIGADSAKISWTTDIDATSQVAIAPETGYKAGAREPYQQVIGDIENLTRTHSVSVYGLNPDTTYHFQLRSKAIMGPLAKSADYTFKTSIEELAITSFFSQIIDQQTAVFKWVTNKEADSTVKVAPYHGNIIAVDESKVYKDNAIAIIHEVKVADLQGGVIYNIELASMDGKGNVAAEVLSNFSTAEDDAAPEIGHIKADSTVFLDRDNKTQTIISWTTNEPSTSRIYYQEGVQAADATLTEATNLNSNYTKDHVMVITKFKAGVVYSFRVESVDSGNNISLSKMHTFMTAKKSESIIQVIIRILEETFGWAKKLT